MMVTERSLHAKTRPDAPADVDAVFREHYASVYRLALGLAGRHADAEDIAQDVFVAVIKALPGFRHEAALSTWIYRITLRVGARWLAKRADTIELPADLSAADQSIPLDLINALNALPLASRLAILLVAVEGLSHREAADVLAVPEGTVASRVHYARKRLALLLG